MPKGKKSVYQSTNGWKEFSNIVEGISSSYTLTIQSSSGGYVSYNGTNISATTKTFTIDEGSSATLTITPDSEYRLASLTVNGTNVTTSVSNNQYTISNITANTSVVATFEQIPVTGIEVNATNFPDEAFRNWVLQNVSGASDGILTDEEIANVTSINCSNKNISSLQGIEFFTALTSLDCSYNKLTVLDVSQNTALTDLYCPFNQLTTLNVSKNTALYYLFCSNNQLLYLNLVWREIQEQKSSVTPQSAALSAQNISEGIAIPVPTDFDFTKVSNLKLAGANANGSITTVDGQKYLVFAQSGTAQNTIDGKELTYTYSTGNKYSVAASMDVTVTLSYTETTPTGIKVNDTNFPDEAFRNWVLQNVSGASDGILTDEEITKVTSINCCGTSSNKGSISNLQGIEFFTALTELNCSYNQLTTLNVSKNTELKTLRCHSNKLTTLGVSNNTALTSLDCGFNQLTTLDVSYNTELDELRCHSNQLETLNVNNNTELTNLYCSSNKLTTLSIINNMKLGELRCSSNQLTTLSIGVKSLYILDCSSNQLTKLDVSYISLLQRLDCSSNQLTTLDVSNNWGLQDLSCSSNQLTKLDVSKNTALEWLKCESNQLLYLNLVTNTKISSSGTSITPQTATLTAKNVSEGIAIPVPTAFDFTKVSNLKLAGSNVNGSITTVNGQKYLVFAQAGTAQSAIDGKSLTYSYSH